MRDYPIFISSDQDKYYAEVFCREELEHWRTVMEHFHSIERGKWGGLTKRLKMRGTLEKAWKNLKQAFMNILISVN